MAPDTQAVPGTADHEVMAAVDDDGAEERLIIADVESEEAWLSMPTTGSTSLRAWE
ncbi:DUF7556 family protein [Halospeciosus flavus]|uniref:Uncharacterized protein n=1 Tax=Halospeciosus flavus TaxID=3032283 RepID=A0ABD5Z797_9EURY|nr:hypothetical protein [Halospeciosus flavus]